MSYEKENFEIRIIEILIKNKDKKLTWSQLRKIYSEKYGLVSKAFFSRTIKEMRQSGFIKSEPVNKKSFFVLLNNQQQ